VRASTAPGARAFPIGVLSRRTGCNIETIRYYERLGLLPAPERTGGGHRVYDLEHLRRLRFVRRARALGFSLDEVRTLLRLSLGGESSCARVRDLAAAHLTDVREKLAGLRAMELVLQDTIRRCDHSSEPSCPLIDALSSEEP
jgi:MerR family transcriptional regulator, mercuric resistance operon regulatory protein